MSRRSVQRKAWHSIYRNFDGQRGLSAFESFVWLLVVAFVLFMLFA